MDSMASDPLRHVLKHLEGVEERNGYFVALCPGHDDHDPSLHIKEAGQNGNRKVLLTCRAGCDTEKVLKKAGLKWGDLFAKNGDEPTGRNIVATYDYTSPTGELLHQTVRYEPKGFSQRRPDGKGDWKWDLKGVEPVLYDQRGVMQAVLAGETVYLLEGEKDCDRAREALGITATTCAMGAKKWRDSYTHTLASANVVLVPDNDEAGRKHVLKVAEELQGVAASVKVLELPGLLGKGDLSDWLDAGGTKEEFERLSSSSQPHIPSGDSDDVSGVVRFVDLGEPKPREFIVEDLVPQGHPCLMHGGGGSAKSILAALLGICISSGNLKEFLDRPIFRHGPALIIDFELEVDEQHRRVKALCEGLETAIPDNLYYLSALGMETKEAFERAVKVCEKLGVVFAVIDSIGFAMRGDMESSKDVNAFYGNYVDPLRAVGVTPMIIDHQGKLQTGESYQRKTAFGSAFKEHRARSVLQIEAVENDRDAGILKVRIRHKKANFSPRLEPFDVELTFGPGRIDVKSVELTAANRASEETLSATERIRLALKDGDKTTAELSEFTGLSREYLWNILPTLEREGTVRVVKTEGRTKTYGLPKPPNGGGDKAPKKEKPTRRSEGSNIVPFPGSPIVDTPENLSSPSQHLYRDEDGDDTEEGSSKEPPPVPGRENNPVVRSIDATPKEAQRTRITTQTQLAHVIEDLKDVGLVALDLETTGLDPHKDSVRLLSLATKAATYLVDCQSVDPADLFPTLVERTVVAHNALFDLSFLASLGFEPGKVADTMILSQLLYAGSKVEPLKRGQTSHSLDSAVKRELDVELDKIHQSSDWGGTLTSEMIEYAAKDVEVLLPLYEVLKAKIEEADLAYIADIEHRALPAVVWMSSAGVPVDADGWREHARKMEADAERLEDELKALAPEHPDGNAWNFGSPQQVQKAAKLLGIDLPDTKDETLALYAKEHEFISALRNYRKASKLASTYGTAWLYNGCHRDGRIYASWRQLRAATGRMACDHPNLQNIPRSGLLRSYIRAPEGRVFVIADYSQIELRIAAKISGDKGMLSVYAEGRDLHTLTAQSLIGRGEISKDDRKLAKAVNFGLLYGMGAKGLQSYALKSYGIEMSLEEATRYRRRFFETYPGLKRWHEQERRAWQRDDTEVRTLPGRRRRGVERLTDRLNSPVQGTGADGLKLALALLWERRDECPGGVLVLACHDEIVVECDEGDAKKVEAWLKKAMIDGMDEVVNSGLDTEHPDLVPIEVDVEILKSWGGD